jgi:hypothetical protein
MKKILFIGVLAVCCGQMGQASTEQQRQLEYSLTSLDNVTTMVNRMSEKDGSWSTNVTTAFVGGVAKATMDLTLGPAYYNASSEWVDSEGNQLFTSYGSIKKIESGMNYLDFPMYISYWRSVSVQLKQAGATSNSDIWVNGSRAYYDGEKWRVWISALWNVTELTILWGGHGQWVIGVGPTFDYGQTIKPAAASMDSSVTVPSQAFGLSYLAELSNPQQQELFVSDVQYDQSLGASVLVCYNTLYKNYGSFKVMVALEYYDQALQSRVQYFSRYVDVQDGMFMIPLVNGNGGNLQIVDCTFVRFIYQDPSDGGVCKQQWDSTLYTDPNGGKY